MSDLPPYDPSNWYWRVAGGATRFHSARAAYVATSDVQFVAWLAQGNLPTNIASEAELWDVLADQYPIGIPAGDPVAQDAYKSRQINEVNAVLFKIAFNHENRIRALEGRGVVTQAQFMAAVKGLL